ncbi:MAG: tyrosine-type recombinase/integrase [Verrucomicrobiaceae bacterium]|nr:tyrosine-type recombinase/integrase [Verrucomicrobiaceae bacterium]
MIASSQVKSSLPASSSENGDEHQDSQANRKSAQKVHRLKVRHPKTAAAHWLAKVRKPAGSALYGVQISYKGRRHRFPLETANREAAAEKARGIYLSLVSQGWQGALECYKPKAVIAAKAATIGAWAQCVKETAGLRLSTFTTYLQSLRQIAAEIEGIGDQPVLDELGKPKKDRKGRPVLQSRFDYRSGGRDAWIAKVDALPLTVLTDSAVQRWKLQYIGRAGGSPEARRRAENSAATLLRCARSLFAPKTRKFASKELLLPDPLPFAGIELPKRGSTTYQSKIDAGKLIEAARAELDGEPFKIFALGLLCGLRKREIDLLTWSQVDFSKSLIRIERTEYFAPKSEDSVGVVDLDAEMVALLRGWKAETQGVFVIKSNRPPRHETSRVNYRCEPHFEALYTWLKTQGVTARKPLHELRKELGALLASTQGIFAAQSVLRHAQISTTAAYYADKKRRITAGLGALLAPVNIANQSTVPSPNSHEN